MHSKYQDVAQTFFKKFGCFRTWCSILQTLQSFFISQPSIKHSYVHYMHLPISSFLSVVASSLYFHIVKIFPDVSMTFEQSITEVHGHDHLLLSAFSRPIFTTAMPGNFSLSAAISTQIKEQSPSFGNITVMDRSSAKVDGH